MVKRHGLSKEQLLATGQARTSKGEGPKRRAISIRFELVKEVGEDQDYEFLDEFWLTDPVQPNWHQL